MIFFRSLARARWRFILGEICRNISRDFFSFRILAHWTRWLLAFGFEKESRRELFRLFCVYDCMYCKWITERTRYDITNTMSIARCCCLTNARTHTHTPRCERSGIHTYRAMPNTTQTQTQTNTHTCAARTRLWLTCIHFPVGLSAYDISWHAHSDTRRAHIHSTPVSASHTCTHTHTSNRSYTSFVVCVCMFIDSIAVHVLRSFPVAHTHTNAVWMWIFRLLHILADWIVVIVIITINHFTLFDAIRMDDTLLWMRTCVRVCEPFQYIKRTFVFVDSATVNEITTFNIHSNQMSISHTQTHTHTRLTHASMLIFVS